MIWNVFTAGSRSPGPVYNGNRQPTLLLGLEVVLL